MLVLYKFLLHKQFTCGFQLLGCTICHFSCIRQAFEELNVEITQELDKCILTVCKSESNCSEGVN